MRNVDLESPSSSPTINSGATLARWDIDRCSGLLLSQNRDESHDLGRAILMFMVSLYAAGV